VPIPWTPTGPSLGFGDAPPWLPQPASFAALAASVQEDDPHSMLSLYRAAIALRRRRLAGEAGFDLLDLGPDVLAFRRGAVLCVANMGASAVPLPDGDVLLASLPLADGRLPADGAVWLDVGAAGVDAAEVGR
jgi:alpha-glucosidase